MASPIDGMVLPGQPLQISAVVWNQLMEMLHVYRNKRFSLSGMVESSMVNPRETILVKNNTGGVLSGSYKVVKLGDSVVDVPTDIYQTNRRPCLYADVVTGSTDAIGITQCPLETDSIGPVCVDGVTVCRVKMNDFEHVYANPVAGITTYLESVEGPAAQARILGFWPESTGSGGSGESASAYYVGDTFLALVKLNGQVPQPGVTGITGEGTHSGPYTVPSTGTIAIFDFTDGSPSTTLRDTFVRVNDDEVVVANGFAMWQPGIEEGELVEIVLTNSGLPQEVTVRHQATEAPIVFQAKAFKADGDTGGTGTTGGLTFKGGLFISGTATGGDVDGGTF